MGFWQRIIAIANDRPKTHEAIGQVDTLAVPCILPTSAPTPQPWPRAGKDPHRANRVLGVGLSRIHMSRQPILLNDNRFLRDTDSTCRAMLGTKAKGGCPRFPRVRSKVGPVLKLLDDGAVSLGRHAPDVPFAALDVCRLPFSRFTHDLPSSARGSFPRHPR